jgi:hypothetical protein
MGHITFRFFFVVFDMRILQIPMNNSVGVLAILDISPTADRSAEWDKQKKEQCSRVD